MRGMHMKSLWGGVAASALLFTVGCGATQNTAGVRAQEVAGTQQAGAPVVVSCEPHQRTLVRPVVVNGAVTPLDMPGLGMSLRPEIFSRPDATVRVSRLNP